MPRFRDRLPWRRAKDSPSASSSRDSSCAATPPNLAEQVPPGTLQAAQQGQRTEPEPQQTDSSTVEETNEHGQPSAEADTPASVPSLWDRAYVKLKESKPTLVADYEKLLSKELADGSALLKKEQLTDIATRGLERVSEQKVKYTIFGQEYVVKDQVAQVSKLLINLKSFISDAIKVSPEASLAWAGVCVILPLFSNPSTADEAQSSGFDYVTSRMRLYVGFEELLWPKHTQIAPDTKEALEASVEDLYVKILTFQLASVLRFYRGWLGQLGRDLVQFDDWKSMLGAVKKAEITLNDDFKKLHDVVLLKELEKLTSDAEAQCESLRSLLAVAEMQLHITKEILKEAQVTRQLAEANQPRLDIPATHEARYDSAEVHSQAKCLGGTRKSIKKRIESWVNDETTNNNLFWLHGPAGTGKSTVSRTMAEIFAVKHQLAASYFFSRSRQENSELSHFFTTLACQVAGHIPEYKTHLMKALHDVSNEALVSKSPAAQFELLFTKLLDNPSLKRLAIPPQLIIIDALDEFAQQDRVWELLKPLSELGSRASFRLCVLLTSRNTVEIDEAFAELADATFQSLNLHQEYSEESRADIEAYLSAVFEQLGSRAAPGNLGLWPDAADMAAIIRLATTPSPLFIYASTLHKFLLQKGRGKTPRQQLKKWLVGASDGISQLAQIYLPVLQDAFQLTPEERLSKQFGPDAADGHRIIGAVILAGTPVSPITLAGLLDLELDVVLQWLHSLRAVFDVGEDVDSPVKLLHKSFSDFLLDSKVKASGEFWVDADKSHEFMALRCFWRMQSNGIKRDICGLGELGYFSADVEEKLIADCIPSDLKYAATFFFHHLSLSRRQQDNFICIEEFLRTQLLHWLEALSLLRSIATALTAMTGLANSTSTKNSSIASLVHDAYRFVLSHSGAIQTAPLQAYVCALIFSPPASLVRQYYHDEKPDWVTIVSGMESHWDPCLMTIEPVPETEGRHTTAALSSDGSKLAVVLKDLVQVYETEKWTVVGQFVAHDSFNLTLIFSQDGRRLAMAWSNSPNDTTEIWDWAMGIRLSCVRRLGSGHVYLRFCSNDEQLAYFGRSTLEFLDLARNRRVRQISLAPLFTATEFRKSGRMDIMASPGGIELARIISGQSLYSFHKGQFDDTDEEGDDGEDDALPPYDRVTIAFSTRGELMARIRDDVLQLFSVLNGQNLATVTTGYFSESWHTSDLKFFDGDKRLAHVPWDGKLRIWSTQPLVLLQTVQIYDDGPFGVLFLDDRKQMITFACTAGSISIWDMSYPIMSQTADVAQKLVYRERHWPSLSRMVTVSSDAGFSIWDTRSAVRLHSLHGQPDAQGGGEFSADHIRFMDLAANQQRLIWGDWGNQVRVWDLGTRPRMRVLDAPTDSIDFKAISPDGAFLVFEIRDRKDLTDVTNANDVLDGIFHFLDVRDEVAGWPATEVSIPDYVGREFTFSDDGRILVTYSWSFVYIWSFSTVWEHTRRFDVGANVQRVTLSPDNRRIAACHSTHLIKVFDMTGVSDNPTVEIGRPGLSKNSDEPALAFSGTGTFICLRSTGQWYMPPSMSIWDGDVDDPYSPDPKQAYSYKLKWYHASDGRLKLQHTVATAPTAARPVEVEDGGGFLVRTGYGVQKCGRGVRTLKYEGYGMSEDRVWILKGSTRVLFVPAAYRVQRPRIVDSVAILRHNTHIMILQLK